MEARAEKIAVTGVGGGVGQSIMKALHNTTYEVVGIDSEELAVGLHCAASAYKGRYACESDYIDRLLEICRAENVSLLFPGHDIELPPLAHAVDRFREAGVIPMVSPVEVVRMCDDKLATSEFLRGRGLSAPRTWRLDEVSQPEFPVILKPQRGGARSRDTYLARDRAEFETYRRLIDPANCVVQEYIDGVEYTCGSVSFDGRSMGVIAMRRVLRSGDTYKAFVERNARIEARIEQIVAELKPFGACNIQLRVKNGEPWVFEINPRCSGSTAARALAGFNEPRIIADYLLHGIQSSPSIREISILRYWNEMVVSSSRIQELARTGHLNGNGHHL